MKKITSLAILIIFISLSYSCDKIYQTENDDFFYIRNNRADMPVWVCGNKESETFIIMLHGGPGGSAQSYHYHKFFNKFEDSYACVYWDQRAAGASHGNSKITDFTIEQFVNDTEKIVDAIRNKYNNPSIFLCGHSWGGCLGTAFLLKDNNQTKIKGWIELDGGHDLVTGYELSKQFVIDYCNIEISSNNDPKGEYQEIIDWYSNNPILSKENAFQHSSYVNKAYGYTPKNEVRPYYSFDKFFLSPFGYISSTLNNAYSGFNFEFWNINFIPEMNIIEIPSLIIWGQYDGILPLPLAQQAYDALGTSENDKFKTILPNSGHSPVDKDIELFQRSVIDFVNKYK